MIIVITNLISSSLTRYMVLVQKKIPIGSIPIPLLKRDVSNANHITIKTISVVIMSLFFFFSPHFSWKIFSNAHHMGTVSKHIVMLFTSISILAKLAGIVGSPERVEEEWVVGCPLKS